MSEGIAELRLRYEPDEDWCGELHAAVQSDGFAGKGRAWFNKSELENGFVGALRQHPLSAGEPPLIEGGYWDTDTKTLKQCHLRIAIRPYNSTGTLVVQVDLASRFGTSPDRDRHQSVTARMLTDYASLDAFASSLVRVLNGEREVAILAGIVDR